MRALLRDLAVEYREEGWVIPVLVAAWFFATVAAVAWIWEK